MDTDIKINVSQTNEVNFDFSISQDRPIDFELKQESVIKDFEVVISTVGGLSKVIHTEDFTGDGTANTPLGLSEQLIANINGKVDKTDTPLVVYGTDEEGNQTTYSVDSFGKVEDVRINNESIVENKIANISVDNEVIKDSNNLITSGAVYNALGDVDITYTATEPATVDVGGFSIGDQPVDMSFPEFADTLLHKYVSPTISNTISPVQTIYQLGTTLDITMNATVTRRASSKYPLRSLAFYSENVEKERITSGIDVKTGTWAYKYLGVGTTNKTKYYVENLKAIVTDSTGTTATTTRDIAFVAPTFYGKISVPAAIEDAGQTKQYIQTNIESIISNCTKLISKEGTIDYPCNLSVEHYIFITPFTVTNIIDTKTGYSYMNSTSNFNYTRTENGVTTTYKVYYLTHQTTGNGYIFRFSITVSEG